MLPDKATRCHRTGFAETCFKCVTEHGCRLWKHVTLEHDPQTGRPGVDHFDCVDSLVDLYSKDSLRRQVQTTATIDSLRKEVRDANDAGMGSALEGINAQLRHAASRHHEIAPAAAPKLLAGDH